MSRPAILQTMKQVAYLKIKSCSGRDIPRMFVADVRKASAVQLLLGLLTFFVALFIGIFAYFIVGGVEDTQKSFEARSAAAAQVVATNAYWISELANQTLRRVDAALGPALLGSETQLAPVLEGLPSVTDVYIIDAAANTIYSTVPGASKVSVADRDYFMALKEGADFYTSPMIVSRLTGESIFVFSKRILRNGQFAGAIMVSFPESLLEDLWRTLELDEGSTVSMVRDDGQLMARFPSAGVPVDLSASPLFATYLPQNGVGTYTSDKSPVDGVSRVVSYRRVPESRIVALASVASDPGWMALREGIFIVVLIASPILLALMLGGWWIVALLRRDEQRVSALEKQAAELSASADLNATLLREIHHRVKNNLSSVQALIHLQELPEAAKRDLQSRLGAMAAMHEHIYQNDQFLGVAAQTFVPWVVDEVCKAYGTTAEVRYDVGDFLIDRDRVTPLALLLSELATNAFKYAFPDGGGVLQISLHPTPAPGIARLVMRDNGVGITPDPARARPSMGMKLIKASVGQMSGTFEFTTDHGTVFSADLELMPPAGPVTPAK